MAVEDLQARLDRWMAIEKPRIDLFDAQLFRSLAQLRSGEIDQRDLFDGLMVIGDGRPVRTDVRIVHPLGHEEIFEVERTEDQKLVIMSEQVGTIPRMTATIGLSENRRLVVEQVTATWLGDEGPEEIEDDLIAIDTGIISKKKYGEEMLQALIAGATPDTEE